MKLYRFTGTTSVVIFSLSLTFAQSGAYSPRQPGAASEAASPQAGVLSNLPKSAAAPPSEAAVPANTPVITIEGLCDDAQPTSDALKCRTQISRADFEKLVEAFRPNADMQTRRMMAQQYAQLLVMAKQGEKLGVDQDPRFQERLKLLRLQTEAQLGDEKLRESATNVSDADIKAYYDNNAGSFQDLTVTRIVVPKANPEAENTGAASNPATSSVDPKQVAENARQQLIKGEDPAKVQAGVLEALKNKNPAPSTQLEHVRRGRALPPSVESQVFALKPGEVSEVITDPMGYMIYRVDKKEQLPLESAKEEIKRTLQKQRMQDEMAKLMNSSKAQLNEAYFGPTEAGPGGVQPQAKPPTLNSRPYPPSPSKSTTPGKAGNPSSPKK